MLMVKLNQHLPEVHEFADELRKSGIAVEIPSPFGSELRDDVSLEGIWIGCSLPTNLVVPIVKVAVQQWPSLTYLHLSSDHHQFVPESIHYQIYLGGQVGGKQKRTWRPWPPQAIEKLPNDMPITGLHMLIRKMYANNEQQTHVRYIGGPLDGQEVLFADVPTELMSRMLAGNSIYELRENNGRYQFDYLGKESG